MRQTFFTIVILLIGHTSALGMNASPYGHGTPYDRCAYNQLPQRKWVPKSVHVAQEALKVKKTLLSSLQKKIKEQRRKKCIKLCDKIIPAVIRTVNPEARVAGSTIVDEYKSALANGTANCAADRSHFAFLLRYLQPEDDAIQTLARPKRMIAREEEACEGEMKRGTCVPCASLDPAGSKKWDAGAGRCVPVAAASPSRPAVRPVCGDGEIFSGGSCKTCASLGKEWDAAARTCKDPVAARPAATPPCEGVPGPRGGCIACTDLTPPKVWDPTTRNCVDGASPPPTPALSPPPAPPACGELPYLDPNGGLDLRICQNAYDISRRSARNKMKDKDRKNCIYCLKPVGKKTAGRYAHCLKKLADLEDRITELEDEVEELEEAYEEAKEVAAEEGLEADYCVDCAKDNRGPVERFGPTVLSALIGAGYTYFGYNQYNKIWEDNNAKGYPSDPRGSLVLAGLGLGAARGTLNTALSTGAFGCVPNGTLAGQVAGNFPAGLLSAQTGGNVYAQVNGASGLPLELLAQIDPSILASGGAFQGSGNASIAGLDPLSALIASASGGASVNLNAGASALGQGQVGVNALVNGNVSSQALVAARAQLQAAEAAHAQAQLQAARQASVNAIWADAIQRVQAVQAGGVGTGGAVNANAAVLGGTNIVLPGSISAGVGANFTGSVQTNFPLVNGNAQFGLDPNLIQGQPLPPSNQGLPAGLINSGGTGGPVSGINL